MKNAFPTRVIDRIIFQFFNKLFVSKEPNYNVPKQKLLFSIDFLGKHSFEIKKRLDQIVKKQIPFAKIEIVFSSKSKLKNFFNFKDKIPQDLKSLVLYKFTCNVCNDIYIGKTKRHYQVRYSEHLGISKLTNEPLKYNKKSTTAVRDHLEFCKHPNTSQSFKIIGSAKNDFHLKIKESLNIIRENPKLNRTIKSFPLCLF